MTLPRSGSRVRVSFPAPSINEKATLTSGFFLPVIYGIDASASFFVCKTVGAQGDPVRLKFVLLLDSLSSPVTKPATVYSSSRRASTFGHASLLVPIILSHGGFQAVDLPHHATAAARLHQLNPRQPSYPGNCLKRPRCVMRFPMLTRRSYET